MSAEGVELTSLAEIIYTYRVTVRAEIDGVYAYLVRPYLAARCNGVRS